MYVKNLGPNSYLSADPQQGDQLLNVESFGKLTPDNQEYLLSQLRMVAKQKTFSVLVVGVGPYTRLLGPFFGTDDLETHFAVSKALPVKVFVSDMIGFFGEGREMLGPDLGDPIYRSHRNNSFYFSTYPGHHRPASWLELERRYASEIQLGASDWQEGRLRLPGNDADEIYASRVAYLNSRSWEPKLLKACELLAEDAVAVLNQLFVKS